MRILLLSPGQFPGYHRYAGNDTVYPIIYPRLGLRLLAALTDPSHEVTILEGPRAEAVEVDEPVDLVGISVLSPHALKAYALADRFRARGRPVVLGGQHVTLNPHEAKEHADAVVIGEGEPVWLPLLRDAEQGRLRPFYRAERPLDRALIPTPVSLDSDREHYGNAFPIETGRGCPVGCHFCVVGPLFGTRYAPRPPQQVAREIRAAQERATGPMAIIFSENLLGHPDAAKALCREIEPLHVGWSAEGDFGHLNDDEYLDMVQRAGCGFIYVEAKLSSRRVSPATYRLYSEVVEKVRRRGIMLSINLTVGYDDNDEALVEDTLEFISRGNIAAYSHVQLLVPWPGSPLFQALDREGRILTRDWSLYNNRHLVFRPKRFTPDKLMQMFSEVKQHLYVLKTLA